MENARKIEFLSFELFDKEFLGTDLRLFSLHGEKMIIKYFSDCSRFKRMKWNMFQDLSILEWKSLVSAICVIILKNI